MMKIKTDVKDWKTLRTVAVVRMKMLYKLV